MHDGRTRNGDDGLATIEIIVIIGFSLMLLVFITNLIAIQFGLGVLRASADEGARAGSRVSIDPVASCQRKQEEVLRGLGRMAMNIEGKCAVENGRMTAQNSAEFSVWMFHLPNVKQSAYASSVKEERPVATLAVPPAGQSQSPRQPAGASTTSTPPQVMEFEIPGTGPPEEGSPSSDQTSTPGANGNLPGNAGNAGSAGNTNDSDNEILEPIPDQTVQNNPTDNTTNTAMAP